MAKISKAKSETTSEQTHTASCAELSFEKAMERLEEIANMLENGQASLDESLALYEEGIALVRHCNEKLDHAEQKIRILDPNMSIAEA